jgi:Sigma-70 region 2
MSEEMRVVAGQVIVNAAIPVPQTQEDALEIAVREHARLVYRIAYSVLRNHHDAEGATQETFMRVLRYQRKLAGIRSQLQAAISTGGHRDEAEVSAGDSARIADLRFGVGGCDPPLAAFNNRGPLHFDRLSGAPRATLF